MQTFSYTTILCALLVMGACSGHAAPDYIWWEAENPKSTNFPARHSFEPQNPKEADALSEGRWIGADGEHGAPLFLEYAIRVPKDAVYHFYARKFWKHGPFRWRFDSRPWQTCGRDVALLDSVELRQFVVANWVALGEVELKAGSHLLRIELTEPRGAAAFDCFILTPGPFVPNGRLKPGAKLNRAPEGWFPFEPDADDFSPSPIDLRSLNEKVAGENGFIQTRGQEFIHGATGRSIRFWGVNVGPDTVRIDRASVKALVRHLAKRGVNLVRIHGAVWRDDLSVDTEYLDRLFFFISALKREGIYTALSIYFPLWLNLRPEQGFEGYTGQHPFALLFFNPRFQEIYKGWWRAILTTPNPYTQTPLNREPALAFAEIINEDSYLFWTFQPYNTIPAPQMAILERQFGDWLKEKYGSLPNAFAKWGGGTVRGDDATGGRAGFMPLWNIFNDRTPRAQDTAEFLTRHQKAFFERMRDYLKRDLGFGGCLYGSNWITADATRLGPLDKYSNTVCDLMDRHGYFGGPHEGERASYSLNRGDRYNDRAAVLFQSGSKERPDALSFENPIMDIAYNDKPSIISEINWPMPNRYRADMPLLSAAYGALQGSDGFCFFAAGGAPWQQTHTKFGIQTPVVMGQFPAAALLYRKGMVKPGETVVRAELKLADLYALKGAPVAAPQNLDEFRTKDVPPGKAMQTTSLSSIDPLAFLVGRVEMNITEPGGVSKVVELSKYIDRDSKTVRSTTGELLWDYGRGLVRVNAPRAQGATGFLQRAGTISLDNLTVTAGMEYGTILLVALDDRPLATSRKMLLQVMSEDANYGWSAPGAGLRAIEDLGGAPIVVKKFEGTVVFRRPDAGSLRITPLDFNGYRTRRAVRGKTLSLEAATMYYLIEAP